MVFSYTNPDEPTDGEIEAMTPYNCDTENWAASANEDADPLQRAIKKIVAWFKWIKELFGKLFKKG